MSWIDDILNIKPIHPDFWENYAALFSEKADPQQDIEEIGFTVFDTETTGLDTSKDLLISLAAVKVKNNRISVQNSLELHVKQDDWKGNESVEVHQILPSKLESGQYEMELIETFLKFIGTDILVAHHAAFDIAMVNRVIHEKLAKKLLNSSIDTLDLAQRLERGKLQQGNVSQESMGLDALCERYGIEISDRHTAAGDTLGTALLLMKLLSGLKKRGISTRSDLGIR